MIFPPDSILELRHELAEKMNAETLTEADAFRQALAVDPNDPAALRFHAFTAEEAGDLTLAADYGRRFLLANPTSHEGYLLLGRVLPDAPLAAAYGALGKLKLHFDPEARAELEAGSVPAAIVVPADEPPAVTAELEAHRLVHELFVAGLEAIEASLVDRFLARPAETTPLLLGILNAYGEDLLSETDDALVVRALALLGEFGDPALLAPLAKFISLEDDTLGGAARWAFQRVARRQPEQSLAVIRNIATGAEPLDLACLAQQICTMPEGAGRTETLLYLAANLEALDTDGAALVVLSMMTAAYLMEGSTSALAASFESEFGRYLTSEARKELKSLRGEADQARIDIAAEVDPDIYEICLEAFEAADEEEAQPYVRPEPKVGRNDPCWCGSGKKYKKCHLGSAQN